MKCNDGATFTTSPLSPDYQIFAVRTYNKKRPPSTYVDSGIWIGSSFYFDIEEPLYYRDIKYVQGVVYRFLPFAMIGAFDVALKQWKIRRYPPFDDAKNWLMYDYLIDSGSVTTTIY